MQFIDLKKQYEIIKTNVKKRFDDIMTNTRFIMGQEINELEERLAQYVGKKYCITCSSGTDALILPLMAYGIGKGDAVFVPAFTFFASAEVISFLGATPIFVDVKEDTFNIDIDKLEEAIENVKKEGKLNGKAIIAVDLFGQPAEYNKLEKLAGKHKLRLIEDGAQGFGGQIADYVGKDGKSYNRKSCSFGDVASTSFFPAKPLGCYGDGGAVFTNDESLFELMKSIRIHGQGLDKYENVRLGINGRLDTLQGAVLLEKLTIFDLEIKKRNEISEEYSKELRGIVETPYILDGYTSAWAQYTLKVENSQMRQDLIDALQKASIPTAIYYPTPLHKQKVFASLKSDYCSLEVSETLSNQVFSIPMHPYLDEKEIKLIVDTIKSKI